MKIVSWIFAGVSLAHMLPAQCTNGNLTFTNQTLASGGYAATGTITADAGNGSTTTTIPSGASVSFQAGTSIVLLPNFHVASGSSFTASIASCTSPTLTSVGVSPGTMNSGSAATLTATLSAPAPSGGASIALSASPSSPFPVPAQITVLAGQTSASTQVTAGSVGSPTSVTVTGTFNGSQQASVMVDPAQTALQSFIACVGPGSSATTCTLPTGSYTISQTILIGHSNVTVSGGSSQSSQTLLVRDPAFTGPMIEVSSPQFTSPGITVENLTVCGGLDVILDINTSQNVSLGASPVGCPRNQTTQSFSSGSCGDMVHRITSATMASQSDLADFTCVDFAVDQADTGAYPASPFSYTGPYSLTISNVDLEDSTGHALSLFETGTFGPGAPPTPKLINDLYINGVQINRSAVTGILIGANFAPLYDPPVCDNPGSNWLGSSSVFAPRNIRIENSSFSGNNTGAMGADARWVALRNNTFTNNYIHPQVGNGQGGTIEFDSCTDQLQISGNTFTAPPLYAYTTDGLELYSRDIQIQSNNISGYPVEGVSLFSTFGSSVTNNTISNNARQFPSFTGGIAISTTQSILGPCGDPRDSEDIAISSNNVTGQPVDVYFHFHDLQSTDTLRHSSNPFAVDLSGTDTGDAVTQDSMVVLDSYGGQTPVLSSNDYQGPRTLTVRAISPITSRCTAPSLPPGPETFSFPAAEAAGVSNIALIEVIFSVSGADSDGSPNPDTGAQGCHFAYYPQVTPPPVVYLDGPNGGYTWSAGSSVVGAGGTDLSNGYCTIHAGWTPAPMSQPYISPYILNLPLVIEFADSTKRHIYSVVEDDQGNISNGGMWRYWGWWIGK